MLMVHTDFGTAIVTSGVSGSDQGKTGWKNDVAQSGTNSTGIKNRSMGSTCLLASQIAHPTPLATSPVPLAAGTVHLGETSACCGFAFASSLCEV